MAKTRKGRKTKRWMQGAVKRPGAFTRKAKAAGKSVAGYAAAVKSNPKGYSTLTRQQANFARTATRIARRKK